jgi:NAD(P)-dependent dehydrogenase (short-subunit alcohol dehydrogenase family)
MYMPEDGPLQVRPCQLMMQLSSMKLIYISRSLLVLRLQRNNMFNYLKNFISKHIIFPKVEIRQSDDLSGVVVLITGASKGIGQAIAEVILKKGGKVIAASRSLEDLKNTFPEKNESLVLHQADVTSDAQIQEMIKAGIKHFGKIDVLINNAALNIKKPIEEVTEQDYEETFNTNVRAAFLTSKNIVPLMKKQGRGTIINIGSKISHNTQVGPNKSLYAASKYALEGFSFALNRELKPFGIRVTCLMPGTVNTFVSMNAKEYMSPYHVAEVVATIIRLEDIDFESLVFKSKHQNI